MRDPRTNPAYDKADALRQRLRDTLKDAQAALTDAEENNRRLHRELDVMTASNARRWLVGARQSASRAARIIRHPIWTVGTVARGLAATSAPAAARRAFRHLRQRSLPLRLSSPARRWTNASEESMAIRWIGPINLRHRTFEALLCHPPGGLEYRTKVPAGSRFVCECALSPQVWQEYPPRIDFTVVVQVPAAGGWRQERKISIDPGAQWTDRRWHTIAIDLPQVDDPAIDAIVTLETSVAGGAVADNAWAIFGEPRFEWRRKTGEMRRSLATFAERIRTSGLRSSLELLRVTGIASPDAESYPRWVARNTRNEAALAEFARDVAALPYQPRISIVVPVYNTDPQWLRACIESVRRQTYTNWELCLCDDASTTPATIQTLREYRGTDNRTLVRSDPHSLLVGQRRHLRCFKRRT